MMRNAIMALAVSAVLFGSAGEASAFGCKKKKACPVATTSYVVAQPACGCGSSGIGYSGGYSNPGYYGGSSYGNSYPATGYAQPGYPSSGYGGSMGYPRAGGFQPFYR